MAQSPGPPQATSAPTVDPLDSCRLPTELLALTLEHLRIKGALQSIGSAQRCSRRSYDIATPILYRELHLTTSINNKLLENFERILPEERHWLTSRQHLDSPKHSIVDLPLPCRLRRSLGHIRIIRMCGLQTQRCRDAVQIIHAFSILSPQSLLSNLKSLEIHRPPYVAAETELGGWNPVVKRCLLTHVGLSLYQGLFTNYVSTNQENHLDMTDLWSRNFSYLLEHASCFPTPEGIAETATLYRVGPRICQVLPGTLINILQFDDHIFRDVYQEISISSNKLLKLRTKQLVSSTAFRLKDSALKCRVSELPRIVARGAVSGPFMALDELIRPSSQLQGAEGRLAVLQARMAARFKAVIDKTEDEELE